MKKVLYTLSVIATTFILLTIYRCETDPDEICKLDPNPICEDKNVTTCCTEDECVYKYNGKEYPDSDEGRIQLAKDMGCSSASLKSNGSVDYTEVVNYLIALKQNVLDEMK